MPFTRQQARSGEPSPSPEDTSNTEGPVTYAQLRDLFAEQRQGFESTMAAMVQAQLQPVTSAQEDLRQRIIALEERRDSENRTDSATVRTFSATSNPLRLKLKPFDGSGPLDLYLEQANIVAQANQWSEDETTYALAAQLQGPAIAILAQLQGRALTYQTLVAALEDRFGDKHLQHVRYGELRCRRQQPGETLQVLATEVECLARKAFVGVAADTFHVLSTTAFVDAIADTDVQKFVRLGGPKTVREALAKALEISAIQKATANAQASCPAQLQPTTHLETPGARQQPEGHQRVNTKRRCFQCGRQGHLAAECYSASGNGYSGPQGRDRV